MHDQSPWCWCQPKIIDDAVMVMIVHRNVVENTMAGRMLYGGPEEESAGEAAIWIHVYPTK